MLALLLCSIFVSGCEDTQAPKIRLAFSEEAHYQVFHLLTQEPLQSQFEAGFELFPTTSPAETSRLFKNSIVDFAALDLSGALQLADAGNISIIGMLGRMQGTRALLAREGINSVADLRGRRVGAYRASNRFLENMLNAEGMSAEDVEFVYIPNIENERLLEQGQIDAVVSLEPQATRLKRAGFHELYNASQTSVAPIYVLVARTDFVAENDALVQLIIRGWREGISYANRSPLVVSGSLGPKIGLQANEFQALLDKFDANNDLSVGHPERFLIEPQWVVDYFFESLNTGPSEAPAKLSLYWEK